MLIVIAIVFTICTLILDISITDVKEAYDKHPNYKECSQYYFENVTYDDYVATANTTSEQTKCYCRFQGYDKVTGNGDGNSSLTGIKTL